MNWTAQLSDKEVTLSDAKLREFASTYVSDDDLLARISRLFWFDAYVLDATFGVGTHEILSVVNNLESGEPHNGTKPASQFRNSPLRGLWHKHYFSARFLPANISLSLGKNGLQTLINDVFDSSKPVITSEMIEEIARRLAVETVETRANDGKLTGEWLIYVKHEGKNYYLCLSTHNTKDQDIYDRINEFGTKDFPEVLDWIKHSEDSMP